MVNRNETWAQGSQPGDPPISVQIVPIPPEELEEATRRERLKDFPTQPQTLGTIANAVSDLVRHLGLDA